MVTLRVSSGPAAVTVPDLTGLSQADAEAAIEAAGLAVGVITTASSDTVPAGHVISQNPPAGTEVGAGNAVDLIISSAPELVTVPDVTGLNQADAEAVMEAAGLVVGTVSTAPSYTVPAGQVISQNPAAGTSAAPGSAVDLVVSSGPELVTVPDVSGLGQADAEAAIVAAGLTVGTVTTSSSDTVPTGDVISHNPAAGSSVALGSAVDFVVSSDPASGELVVAVDIRPQSCRYPLNTRARGVLPVAIVGTAAFDVNNVDPTPFA